MMKEKRLQMDRKTFSLYDQNIYNLVLQHPYVQNSKMIACYVSLPNEVDTLALIETFLKTKSVCVPRVEGTIMHFYQIDSLDELQVGHFHVLEPTTSRKVLSQDIDIMLVPMMAFDGRKYRVGYGKGYYDKYFASGYQGYKLGLAYAMQYVNEIAVDEYDYALDEIITESDILK